MPEAIAKKCSTPVSSVEKVKQQQQLPLCNHGVFSSTPSPSELSIIKLEHFSNSLSCLCLNTREWSPIMLVLGSEVVLGGEC